VPKSAVSGETPRAGSLRQQRARRTGTVVRRSVIRDELRAAAIAQAAGAHRPVQRVERVNDTGIATNIEARNFGQLTGAAGARDSIEHEAQFLS